MKIETKRLEEEFSLTKVLAKKQELGEIIALEWLEEKMRK